MKQKRKPIPERRTFSWFASPANVAFALILVAITVAYVVLHFRAAYTMPFPWPDEAHFLWQANGFAEHFNLFAPELNADRSVFWMPPGYLIVLGIALKLFGLSLMTARTLSLLLMLVSIGILAAIVRRYSMPVISLVLSALFILGAPFIAAGNIGRMEVLLVLLILWAFFLMQRGRLVLGIFLLALTPLVHPNGLYFFASGLIAALLIAPRPITWRRLTSPELAMATLVICAWIGYAIYASLHWHDFIQDMTFQFERKAVRNIKDAVIMPCSVSLFVLVLLGSWYCWKNRLTVIFLLALAAPAWWVAAAGIEMWYRVFFSISFFLLAVIAIGIAVHIAQHPVRKGLSRSLAVVTIVVAGSVIAWNVMSSSFGEPLVLGQTKPWYWMSNSDVPYITATDQIAVQARIDQISRRTETQVVEFYPAADAFFFVQSARDRIPFSSPLFCVRHPDWYFVHLSPRFPPAFNKNVRELLADAAVEVDSLVKYQITATRNGEAWFVIPGQNNPDSRRRP